MYTARISASWCSGMLSHGSDAIISVGLARGAPRHGAGCTARPLVCVGTDATRRPTCNRCKRGYTHCLVLRNAYGGPPVAPSRTPALRSATPLAGGAILSTLSPFFRRKELETRAGRGKPDRHGTGRSQPPKQARFHEEIDVGDGGDGGDGGGADQDRIGGEAEPCSGGEAAQQEAAQAARRQALTAAIGLSIPPGLGLEPLLQKALKADLLV